MFGNSIREDNSINNQLKEIFEIKLNEYTYGPLRYVPPLEICPYAKGFQSLESDLKGLRIEGGGFCGMWSLFFMEMVLNNPTKTTIEILDKVMNITEQKPEYLKDIIRGYVIGTEKELDKTAKFLKKEGFSFYTENKLSRERKKTIDLNDTLTQEFILNFMFETEKEQREKKEFKILPEPKQLGEEQLLRNDYFNKLNSLTKQKLINIPKFFGLGRTRFKQTLTKDEIITVLIESPPGFKYPKEEVLKILHLL
jgi:hypothetical protein